MPHIFPAVLLNKVPYNIMSVSYKRFRGCGDIQMTSQRHGISFFHYRIYDCKYLTCKRS